VNRIVSRLIGVFAVCAVFGCAAARAQTPDAAQRAQARAILEYSVNLDTSVEGRRTPELARYLADQFRAAGFPAGDITLIPFEHIQTSALVVRLRGDGGGGRPILLLAHMDVVPARRADWERDPFTMVEENGYFYGRGVYDNKAGIAALVSTLIALKADGFTPARDLILVLTGDEETLGVTSTSLLRDHRALIDGEFALNADAGGGGRDERTGAAVSYFMQTAEKTFASFTLTARNEGGHSSAPRPDNAIYDLVDALARVRAYQFPVMWNDTTLESFRAAAPTAEGELGEAMTRFAQRPGDQRASHILSASPSTLGQIRTTCVPTLLEAGHADNALPQSAVATVNCRIFPSVPIAEVQAQLQRLAGARIAVAPLTDGYIASDASPLRDDIIDAVAAAVRANYPGLQVVPSMSAGATDGVFFRAAGIPTYGVDGIFIKDSDDFSHGLNERVPVDSFYANLTHWRVLLTTLAGRR
jgi:acetylornithine deacetylase/succinyl-diaminopimelate desuccinylase-like protein